MRARLRSRLNHVKVAHFPILSADGAVAVVRAWLGRRILGLDWCKHLLLAEQPVVEVLDFCGKAEHGVRIQGRGIGRDATVTAAVSGAACFGNSERIRKSSDRQASQLTRP